MPADVFWFSYASFTLLQNDLMFYAYMRCKVETVSGDNVAISTPILPLQQVSTGIFTV